MKKYLVVGGAGYIGSHMVRQLRLAGLPVVVFDNLERGNADAVQDAELVVGDINDRAALDALFASHEIEAVLHFAAFAYVGESVSEPGLYYRNNVCGTLNLLEAMRAKDVKRLVFSSTCATYGVPDSLPITEKTPQHPINPYGMSKLMVERVLQDYAHAHGLRSISLRYFNASGAAEDGSLGERHDPETHLLPLVLFEALRIRNGGNPADTALRVFGNDLPTPDGTCVRDYIHVSDLCSAHVAALQRMEQMPDAGAEQFNLGVNRGFSVLEVIETCRRVTGEPIQFIAAPPRDGDPPALVADASLAMRDLKWSPQHRDVEVAITHAWNWFLKHPPQGF